MQRSDLSFDPTKTRASQRVMIATTHTTGLKMKAHRQAPDKQRPYPTHPKTGAPSPLQLAATASPQSMSLTHLQMMADSGAPTQRLQQMAPAQPNKTGLPDTLKSGIESLSGMSMDHVRVHRNSAKPAQLQAHAFAQGSDIHLGPGQERHLPHEAWHVVQQAQGRVKPTMQMKGIGVNDDAGLEKEADVMGMKAAQLHRSGASAAAVQYKRATPSTAPTSPLQMVPLQSGRLNVVGEQHPESSGNPNGLIRRNEERNYQSTQEGIPANAYWLENEFRFDRSNLIGRNKKTHVGDPFHVRVEQAMALFDSDVGRPMLRVSNLTDADVAAYLTRADSRREQDAWNFRLGLIAPRLQRVRNNIDWSGEVSGEAKFAPKLALLRQSIDTFQTSILATEPIYARPATRTLRRRLATDFMACWNPVHLRYTELFGHQVDYYDNVSVKRSEEMHKAANSQHNTPGVWKIGDAHVAHIRGAQWGANQKYNLVDRATYNAALYAWNATLRVP